MKWFCMLIAGVGLSGCASTGGGSSEVAIPAGRYAEAFDAAKDILIASRFELERVDAAGGVLSTVPKPTAGLATPWDTEQASLSQELDDVMNRHLRTVRITFEGAEPRSARIEAVVERERRAGWRLDTTSLRYTSVTEDPALRARGMWPRYHVAIAQDPDLAASLATELRSRLGLAEPGRPAMVPGGRREGPPPVGP